MSNLKSVLDYLFEAHLGKFNMDVFKKLNSLQKKQGYAKQNLRELGEGSARTAFALSTSKVLKVVNYEGGSPSSIQRTAERGWAQNKAEIETWTNPKTKAVPIVVFTNLDTEKDREKCEQMGAAAYIFKREIEPRKLLATVAEIIKKDREKKNKKKILYDFYHAGAVTERTLHSPVGPLELTAPALPGFDMGFDVLAFLFSRHFLNLKSRRNYN